MPDVIVVGAGHNGLVAAGYLARAGRDVLVVEAADVIGGCTTTAPVPGAPGYYVNPAAFDVIALRISTIGRDLELARHGYREVEVDPCYVALGHGGESLAFWRDPRRTATEIQRFSARDARAFLDLMRELDHVADAMLPMMLTNPTPGPARPAGGAAGGREAPTVVRPAPAVAHRVRRAGSPGTVRARDRPRGARDAGELRLPRHDRRVRGEPRSSSLPATLGRPCGTCCRPGRSPGPWRHGRARSRS